MIGQSQNIHAGFGRGVHAEDWPQFRGINSAGVSHTGAGLPEKIAPDGTIAWKLIGPMSPDSFEREVKPQILKAMAPSAS